MTQRTEAVHHITDNKATIIALLHELRVIDEQVTTAQNRLSVLQAQVHRFDLKYHVAVGSLYVRLDELEAEIAERLACDHPKQDQYAEQARAARQRAEETAREAHSKQDTDPASSRLDKEPPLLRAVEEAKNLLRRIAKMVHPDLANDDIDKSFREQVMVAANLAKENGDTETLGRILADWEATNVGKVDPDVARIAQLTSYVAQARQRLSAAETETRKIKASEIFKIKARVEAAEMEGVDLLARMVIDLQGKISAAEIRLARLRDTHEEASRPR